MRDKLDELRFKVFDISYSLKLWVGRLSDGTKYLTLSFLLVLALAGCTFVFTQVYGYEAVETPKVALEKINLPLETLDKAEQLKDVGSVAEAFDLLATHRNHFTKEYNKEQMKLLESLLIQMSEEAKDADIKQLYSMKDLVEEQPLYKFTGMVVNVDNDPLYGVTHLVSNNGERTQEQIEVTGLEDISVGSQVEFYGVPRFDSAASPIKVEAFVVPLAE